MDIAQEIAGQIAELTRVEPTPEMLRMLERAVAEMLTPTVSASLDANNGRVTVRVGRPKHDQNGHTFIINPTSVVISYDEEQS